MSSNGMPFILIKMYLGVDSFFFFLDGRDSQILSTWYMKKIKSELRM